MRVDIKYEENEKMIKWCIEYLNYKPQIYQSLKYLVYFLVFLSLIVFKTSYFKHANRNSHINLGILNLSL